METEESVDMVNRPKHYADSIECIDAMFAAFGEHQLEIYCRLAAFKYLWRAEKKQRKQEDLQKAIWYLRMATGDDPRLS